MKKHLLETAARLRAMPAWVTGLMLILLILLLYNLFLDISHLTGTASSGACPDCAP